jgi:hypothetical protein
MARHRGSGSGHGRRQAGSLAGGGGGVSIVGSLEAWCRVGMREKR